MKRINLCILLSALFVLPLFAAGPAYDAATETALSGDVLYEADGGAGAGMFVVMKDGHNEIQVYLAPRSFLEQEGLQIRLQQSIRIVGSRTIWNGAEVIVARQVTAGTKTVTLRNRAGDPRW